MYSTRLVRLLILVVAASAAPHFTSTLHASGIRTVALSGRPAPGTPAGAVYSSFTGPSFNNAGQAAFYAALSTGAGGVHILNNTGLWSEGRGPLALVAREGSAVPNMPAGNFFSQLDPGLSPPLNDAGDVAFVAYLVPGMGGVTGANDHGVWIQRSAGMTLLARTGNSAPGAAAGMIFGGFQPVLFNNAGHTAIKSQLCETACGVNNADVGLWSDASGSLTMVMRNTLPAPGTPSGVTFATFLDERFNEAGQIAFRGILDQGSGGVDHRNDEGIWVGQAAGLNLVAREGDTAPGTPGYKFFEFDFLAFNKNGHVAFASGLTESPGFGVGGGIWSNRSGTLAPVSRSGDPAPGIEGNVNFTGVHSWPTINDSGKVAFLGSVWGEGNEVTIENNEGIWSDAGGSLELVAREGDQAPGAPMGAVFDWLGIGALNNARQMAFAAGLRQGIGGISDANDFGIWLQDAGGEVRLVVREGDLLEVMPGDRRAIADLNVSGRPNERGQIAFVADFTDGSQGIFVTAPTLPGDYNDDGAVDAADYILWRKTQGSSVTKWSGADGNGNGLVDAADHTVWSTGFGSTAGFQSAANTTLPVPEPSSALLTVMASAATLCFKSTVIRPAGRCRSRFV